MTGTFEQSDAKAFVNSNTHRVRPPRAIQQRNR